MPAPRSAFLAFKPRAASNAIRSKFGAFPSGSPPPRGCLRPRWSNDPTRPSLCWTCAGRSRDPPLRVRGGKTTRLRGISTSSRRRRDPCRSRSVAATPVVAAASPRPLSQPQRRPDPSWPRHLDERPSTRLRPRRSLLAAALDRSSRVRTSSRTIHAAPAASPRLCHQGISPLGARASQGLARSKSASGS